MEAVFSTILDMSLTASFVIAAILLIRLLLRKAPKKYSYALWAVAAFRLICPVSIESAFSLFNLNFNLGKQTGVTLKDVPEYNISDHIAPSGPVTSPLPQDIITTAPDTIPIATPVISENLPGASSAITPVEPAVTLMNVLAVIWCIGMAVLLIYSVVTYIKLKRRMATAVLLEDNIRQSGDIRSPFILGFIRPQIYIPYRLSADELSYVLAHERYHLKRLDHIVKPLSFLILTVHWFNPLVWLAFHLMTRDMEMSCDEKVLSRDESIRKAYSSTLLSFAAGRSFPAPSPLSFGEGSVKSRIKNVLHWKKPALWLTIAAVIACIVVVLVCATDPSAGISITDVESVYMQGRAMSEEAQTELIELINSHSKSRYRSAPDTVGFADSRAVINCADGSSYTIHHWYCSGFSFNPAHFGEDDYYSILTRINADGEVEKSWKMEYSFDKEFLSWMDVWSVANIFPFGENYQKEEDLFSTPSLFTLDTAESISLEKGGGLYIDGELHGSFQQTALTENNWDELFATSGVWQSGSARQLRQNNFRVWRVVNGSELFYLLVQENGSVYIAAGFYDSEGEYDPYSDDSSISRIYRLQSASSMSVRWQYYATHPTIPDYFPLAFDMDYSSIHLECSSGVIRYLDANGYLCYYPEVVITERDTAVGWWPTPAIDMSVIAPDDVFSGRDSSGAELNFTVTLKDGGTLKGTILFTNPNPDNLDLYEASIVTEGIHLRKADDGIGAVIYVESENTGFIHAYVPVSCVYMAPHSSEYAWGGDSGYRYIIDGSSLTVESMSGEYRETFPVDNWNYSTLSPYSEEWTKQFMGSALTFEGVNEALYLPVSEQYSLIYLDDQLHVAKKSGEYIWSIFAIVPEAQLGSAVWEHMPTSSSRSPWFEFSFDMDIRSIQASCTEGTISHSGAEGEGISGTLDIPAGETLRWNPHYADDSQFGSFVSGAKILLTIRLHGGSSLNATLYIEDSGDDIFTAGIRGVGLRLSTDAETGKAIISGSEQMAHTDEPRVFTTDMNELLNQWQAEGVTTLSAEQCERLSKNFTPMAIDANGEWIINPLSSFFQCRYDRPEDIDLYEFLRYCTVEPGEFTEADFETLKKYGHIQTPQSFEEYSFPTQKYPSANVSEFLMKYAGITVDDLTEEAKSGIVYLEEFDAFYTFTSDFAAGSFICASGEIKGDTAYLYYGYSTLILKKSGDRWLIYAYTYDTESATIANLANGILEIFDIGGEMGITLNTAKNGAHETITVTDRAIAEQISYIIQEHSYTRLEMPYTEPSAYWITITASRPTNKMTFWSGNTQMLQYSPGGDHRYYDASTDGVGSLAWAVRRVYENLLLDHGRIEGFAADTAEAAAEKFAESVYGEHLMTIPAGGVYSIEYYRLMEQEVLEVSADGSSVLGRFVLSVWPEDLQRSGFWAGNGRMGTGDYYGWILSTYEFVLEQGEDGLWHCSGIGTGGYSLD